MAGALATPQALGVSLCWYTRITFALAVAAAAADLNVLVWIVLGPEIA
jgi:hypothetical protein